MPGILIAPVAHCFTAISTVLAHIHRPVAAVLVLLASAVCVAIAHREDRKHD